MQIIFVCNNAVDRFVLLSTVFDFYKECEIND